MTSRPATPETVPSGADLAGTLRGWDDAALAHLLRTRPDLATPPPSSITAMATRAGSRASVTHALGQLDRPTLTVAEALAVMSTPSSPTSVRALTGALGFEADDGVAHLLDRALALGSPEAIWLVEGAREVLASAPLGLGPPLRALGLRAADGWPTTKPAVTAALTGAPEPAKRILTALMWGPAVGSFEQVPQPVHWLLGAKLLHRLSDTQVVLPREVALALRGGRLVREVATAAPLAEAPVRDASTVAAEAARAGDSVLQHLDRLTRAWAQDPPPVLRTGGVGVRDVRALAGVLGAEVEHAALIAELAGMLGLVGHHHGGDGSSWAPTAAGLDPEPDPVQDRWAQMVWTWLESARTPWLVGTRTDKGVLRAALAPDLQRSWAPQLRRRVLEALDRWPAGSAPDAAAVQEHLAWHTPRTAPPETTVAAVLAEAAALGLTGAGALSEPGRVLLAAEATPATVAEAFAAGLPPLVEEMFIQGDLTGIVPGRPDPALARLLEATAQVESRGSAMTVRFTPGSVRAALDGGWLPEQILTELGRFSRTGVPQPLEYLVHDTARTHGQLRVGRAASFLRAGQDGVLTALVGEKGLADLGLRLLAPTVAVAEVGPQDLIEALRAAGHSALAEGPDGQVVALGSRQVRASRGLRGGTGSAAGSGARGGSGLRAGSRARGGSGLRAGSGARAGSGVTADGSAGGGMHAGVPAGTVTHSAADDPDALAELIGQMRTGEEQAHRSAGNGHSQDPVYALELLRQAAAGGTQVELVIAGSAGAPEHRRVRPLSVAGGRVRVLDMVKQAELTVAAHRIVSVATQPG
ncbi:helicase-associated domain-containing protein [Pseudactinotalea sp. Z1748]|uniref:helicase-associated domain-containing protein n=1 Tax=Pseudactinotalea sp. Z1748 TaxID=3413027 RepID=UPI003C7C808F